jgi:hypothetical protein
LLFTHALNLKSAAEWKTCKCFNGASRHPHARMLWWVSLHHTHAAGEIFLTLPIAQTQTLNDNPLSPPPPPPIPPSPTINPPTWLPRSKGGRVESGRGTSHPTRTRPTLRQAGRDGYVARFWTRFCAPGCHWFPRLLA